MAARAADVAPGKWYRAFNALVSWFPLLAAGAVHGDVLALPPLETGSVLWMCFPQRPAALALLEGLVIALCTCSHWDCDTLLKPIHSQFQREQPFSGRSWRQSVPLGCIGQFHAPLILQWKPVFAGGLVSELGQLWPLDFRCLRVCAPLTRPIYSLVQILCDPRGCGCVAG